MSLVRPPWRSVRGMARAGGGRAMLAAFERNMDGALACIPDRSSRDAMSMVGKWPALNIAEELAQALDDDLRRITQALDRHGRVDRDRVRASGRSRPRVALDARVTTAGNLCIEVMEGVPGRYGLPPDESDWDVFPLGGMLGGDGRPLAEVAFVHQVDILGHRRDRDRPDPVWQAMLDVRSDLSGLVVAVWEHCRAVLSRRYDVEEGHVPVLDGDAPAQGPDDRSLRIAPPTAHVVIMEREAREAEEAARGHAEGFLREYAGDPRALVMRWRESPRDGRASKALASMLGAGGVPVRATSAWARLARIDAALRIVEPGWDVAPVPDPVPVAPVEEVAWAEDPWQGPAVTDGPDVEPGSFALAASRQVGDAAPAAGAASRVASTGEAVARAVARPSAGDLRADVEPEPFALTASGPRFRPPAHHAPPPPPPPARDEVSDTRFYARLPRYAAAAEELAALSVDSVDELVGRVNDGLRAKGRARIPQGDFPSTEKRFRRMLKLHADFVEVPRESVAPSA